MLADDRLGRVWLIDRGSSVVGHFVVTFVFAVEYGGVTEVTLTTSAGTQVTWCYVTEPEGNIIELQAWG